MKLFIAILITIVVATNAASSGYRYQQPQRQQPQPIPINIRPVQHHSSPVVQYNIPSQTPQHAPPAPPAISLPAPPPPAPHEIAVPASVPVSAPAPVSVSAPAPIHIAQPQNQYLPPQQHQQVFAQHHQQQQVFSQPQQQVFSAPQQQQQVFSAPQQVQQFAQPIQSIPQGHQQQIFQQQLSQPIQNTGFQQTFQSQQQFSQPIQNTGFQQNVQSFQRPQQTAIITKDIFIHSAPEDHDSDIGTGPQFESGPVRKNYRIVFIKAPTQNLRGAAAALQRAQSNNEEKTIIYVLSKKPDLAEVHQQLQQSQGEQKASKPEVYFIKYKTQEEAQRAQQEIQAQYDALGGSTHISDEGVAPVTNVGGISSGALNLSGPIGGGSGGGVSFQQNGGQQQSFVQQSFQSQSGSGQGYLPPRIVKK